VSWKIPQTDGVLKYFKQAYIQQDSRFNTKGTERATAFSIEDFPYSVPFTVSALSHSFYIGAAIKDSSFKFVIYGGDGVSKLYTSPYLKANHNNEIRHQLTQALTIEDNFYVSVVPSDPAGYPASNTTVVNKSDCHSFFGSAGTWNPFNYTAPAGRELHTNVFVNATYKANQFPAGGYVIYRNNIPIDTINSLEDTLFIDSDHSNGNRSYKVVTYLDTLAHLSRPSDSIQINIGSSRSNVPFAAINNNQIKCLKKQIQVTLYQKTFIQLSLYNVQGKKVREICNQQINSGEHTFVLNSFANSYLSSGLYLLKAKIGRERRQIPVMINN
jgi:hypothetical protein